MEPTSSRRGAGYWLVLVFVGIIGGLLSGAFGVGGGIIMVPLLIGLAGMDQRQAAVTSLVAILPAAVVGATTYGLAGQIDLVVGAVVAVGAILGAVIGTKLLRRISLAWLRWMFIVLLLAVAARMLLVVPVRGEDPEFGWWFAIGLLLLGLVMGIASGLFGIGGGVIAVPALVAVFGMGDLLAKGTSLLIMVPTSVTGTISNARAGLVDLPAGLVVGITAASASVGGAALAFLMDPQVSSILFAALLVIAAVQLAVRAIRMRK